MFPLLVEDSLPDGISVPAGEQGGRPVRRVVGFPRGTLVRALAGSRRKRGWRLRLDSWAPSFGGGT